MVSDFRDVVHDLAKARLKVFLSPYGYTPTDWICVLFVALFSTTTALHVLQVLYVKPRLYWILPTIVTCGLGEIAGWSARLWSSKSVLNVDPFLMQTTTTIVAPTFCTAGLFTILGLVINQFGTQYSRLSPKAFLLTFFSADIIALVVQAVGGANASFAFQNGEDATPGLHIMLVGIFLQLSGIVLYTLVTAEFLLRFHFRRPLGGQGQISSTDDEKELGDTMNGHNYMSNKATLMTFGLGLATFFVLMRTIYRSAELMGGWVGPIITTEKYFNVFDGAPILLAMFTLNLLHPGVLLRC